MAGSYNHIADSFPRTDQRRPGSGKFIGTENLDNMGDAFEALEEMYGMIWLLANGDADKIEHARQHFGAGILLSPSGEDYRIYPKER